MDVQRPDRQHGGQGTDEHRHDRQAAAVATRSALSGWGWWNSTPGGPTGGAFPFGGLQWVLILITAVLEKHAGLKLNSFDVFINVSGGFQINDTAADLAVAVSIASSLKNAAVPRGFGFLGEISLSGEIRAYRVPLK